MNRDAWSGAGHMVNKLHMLERNENASNLVPRVLWLFGERVDASRDSGIMEFLIPENVGFRF